MTHAAGAPVHAAGRHRTQAPPVAAEHGSTRFTEDDRVDAATAQRGSNRASVPPGLQIAQLLALRNYRVLLLDHAIGPAARGVTDFAHQAHGLDAVVITSGHADYTPLPNRDPATYSDVVDADILDPMYVLRAVVPPMLAARSGDIVLIGPLCDAVAGYADHLLSGRTR